MSHESKKKIPPLYSDDITEFDISDALLVVVDGSKLKQEKDGDLEFAIALRTMQYVRFKKYLPLFTHPGYPTDGGLGVLNIAASEDLVNDIVHAAINTYNNLTERGKLKLKKVDKVNFLLESVFNYFLTFSATNIDTGEIGLYQAMVCQKDVQSFMFGSLRDCSCDKVLAILSVTGDGVEEKLQQLRKLFKVNKEYKDAMRKQAHEDARKQDRDPTKDVEPIKRTKIV